MEVTRRKVAVRSAVSRASASCTRPPTRTTASARPNARQCGMIVFRGACSVPRRRVPERAVEILSVHVSASRAPKAPVRSESTLLCDEEAARTDHQLPETSRSCCCSAVAQGQKWHPLTVLATDAIPALTCGDGV